MDNQTNLVELFSKTIDEMLHKVDVSVVGKTTHDNLLSSAIMNFSRMVAEENENIDKVSKTIKPEDYSSQENLEKAVNRVIEELSLDKNSAYSSLRKAMKETLEDFISNLEPKLTPEKTEELKKIVSINF